MTSEVCRLVIDTSALVAILRDEPESFRFRTIIERELDCRISAASYVELGVVIDGSRNPNLRSQVDRTIEVASIRVEPVTETQARIARAAYRDFGRGSGHPARLNFGDCFAYALATELRQPLLFKGNDFAATDIEPALA